MEDKNCKQLLRNLEQIPNEELFKEILSKQLVQIYREILKIISGFGLLIEWRYYKDGKAWLCKITQKKRTIVWISLGKAFLNQVFTLQKKPEME